MICDVVLILHGICYYCYYNQKLCLCELLSLMQEEESVPDTRLQLGDSVHYRVVVDGDRALRPDRHVQLSLCGEDEPPSDVVLVVIEH